MNRNNSKFLKAIHYIIGCRLSSFATSKVTTDKKLVNCTICKRRVLNEKHK